MSNRMTQGAGALIALMTDGPFTETKEVIGGRPPVRAGASEAWRGDPDAWRATESGGARGGDEGESFARTD